MKTALILGAAAVGAYLLLRYMQGASSPIGSLIPGAPAAPGMAPGPTAVGTPAGAQMRNGAPANTRVANAVVLGGIMRAGVARRLPEPPSSFSPSSPGVSINQVTTPDAPSVTTTTNPTPPLRINSASGLSPVTFGFGR